MSYEATDPQTALAVDVRGVSKCYQMYPEPQDRFKQFFMPRIHHLLPFIGKAQYYQEFWS